MKRSLIENLINEFKNLMKTKTNLEIEIENPYLNNKGNRSIAGVRFSDKKTILGFDYEYLKNVNPITLSEKIVHELIHIKNRKRKPSEKWVIKETNKFIKSLYVKDRKLIDVIKK